MNNTIGVFLNDFAIEREWINWIKNSALILLSHHLKYWMLKSNIINEHQSHIFFFFHEHWQTVTQKKKSVFKANERVYKFLIIVHKVFFSNNSIDLQCMNCSTLLFVSVIYIKGKKSIRNKYNMFHFVFLLSSRVNTIHCFRIFIY